MLILGLKSITADGSIAEMCGNGIRCAAIFAKEQNLTDKDKLTFDTLAGLIETEIIDFEKSMVKVNMGKPRLAPHEIPADFPGEKVVNQLLSLGENSYNITLVSMGNPHCVIFVDNVMDYPVEEIGPQIEKHSLFPSLHQCRIYRADQRKQDQDEGLGKRLWRDSGLWDRSLCRSSGSKPKWLY